MVRVARMSPHFASLNAGYTLVGNGARESLIRIEGRALRLLPTLQAVHYVESKEYRPLFAALGQGVARIPVFRFPLRRGGWRATRRMVWITPDRPGSA